MKHQATKGHLQHGSLHLKQTEAAKRKWGKAYSATMQLRKLKAPVLNWKTKEK